MSIIQLHRLVVGSCLIGFCLCWHSPAQGGTYAIDAETGAMTTHAKAPGVPALIEKKLDANMVTTWAIELLSYDNHASAKGLVYRLGLKGFPAQVVAKKDGGYLVQMSNLTSFEQAMVYRRSLLHKTNIYPNHIHIVAEAHNIRKSSENAQKKLADKTSQPAKQSETMPAIHHAPITASPPNAVKALIPKAPTAFEMVILQTTLNTKDVGTHFIMTGNDGDLQITKGLLKKIGLKNIPLEQVDDNATLSLKSMASWITYELDTQSGELALMADPSLLPVNHHKLILRQPSDAELIQDNALFLNYTINYQKHVATPGLISTPFELGLNLGGVSIVNNFSYQQHQQVQRTQTQLVYDDRDNLQRWMAGDIQGSSGSGIGGAALGGISLSKNYGIRPDLFTSPPLELSTMLTTPSEVEVLVGGQSVYKADFPAGQLNLTNIPYYSSGGGNAELIVRDAFGREQVYSQSIYTARSLLASGLSTYNYSFGVTQQRGLSGNLQYGKKPLLFASHRYGLTDWLTPGFGLETDGDKIRGGIIASLLLSNYGQLDIVTAGSRRSGLRGGLLHVNYSYSGTGIVSPNLSFTTQSPGYGGILDPLMTTGTASRWNAGAGLGLSLGSWGSISGRWSKQLSFDHQRSQSGALFFSSRLPGSISLTTQLKRTWTSLQAPDNQTNISLGRYFSNGIFLTANYSRSNQKDTFGMQIQYSPPLGEGFGFSSNITGQPGDNPTANTRLQYRNRYGELSTSRVGTVKSGSYGIQLSSALLLAGGGLHISRPIRDSFALVKVKGIDKVNVSMHHQKIGATDAKGELVMPHLHAYSDNNISIDPTIIPLGYKIESTSKTVTSTYRGGGVVEFNVVKMQTVEGKAYYRSNGKLEPAQYSGIEIDEGTTTRTAIIGHGSLLYLENIPAGTYPARLYNQQNNCHFTLVIPALKQIINDIGDVICEIDSTIENP